MEHDRPLLMKLTVHLTPHGTMIMIPAWWSFDHTRDLNWPEITKLHGVRVPSKQGSKLSRNQHAQAAEAHEAARIDAEARQAGMKGQRRAEWVMEQLKWVTRDVRKLRRILARAKRQS